MFTKPIRVVIINKEKCLNAFHVDLAKLDDKYWSQLPPRRETKHLHELQGAKAYIYRHLVAKIAKTDIAGELEQHWSSWLHSCVGSAFKSIEDPEFRESMEKEHEALRHTQFAHLFDSDEVPAAKAEV